MPWMRGLPWLQGLRQRLQRLRLRRLRLWRMRLLLVVGLLPRLLALHAPAR